MPARKAAVPPPEFEGIPEDPPEPTPDTLDWVRENETDFTPESMAQLPPVSLTDEKAPPRGPRGLIDISGAAYLPARRRVQWMRGDVEPHPEWGIITNVLAWEQGVYQGTKKMGRQTVNDIKGGWALVKAEVVRHTDDGKYEVVGDGHATEYSEAFPDFVEKAETSAIARALAVAGYGTESAVDFDEGPVADSPVRPDGTLPGIFINGSNLPGVSVGAQQSQITEAQFQHIRELARTKELDPLAMKMAVEEVFETDIDAFPSSGSLDEMRAFVLSIIREMSFMEAAALISILELSDDPASP